MESNPQVGEIVTVTDLDILDAAPTEYEIVEVQTRYLIRSLTNPDQQTSAILKTDRGELFVQNSKREYDIKFSTNSVYSEINCSRIDQIEKGKLLGGGSYGKVYEYCPSPENCKYAVKTIPYPNIDWRFDERSFVYKNTKTVKKINDIAWIGLGPRVYKMVNCSAEKVILLLMDKIPGHSVAAYLVENLFTRDHIDKLIFAIQNFHLKTKGNHGDLSPANIIYDGNEFKFIDPDVRGTSKSDFLNFIYHLREFFEISKDLELYKYIFSRFLGEYLKLETSDDRSIVYKNNQYSKFFNEVIRPAPDYDSMLEALEVFSNDLIESSIIIMGEYGYGLGTSILKKLQSLGLEK